MRLLSIRLLLAVFSVLVAWLAAGSQLSSFIDRFFTVPYAVLPLGTFSLDAREFIMGSRRWIMAKDLRVARDAQSRVTLSTTGRTFTFGPIANITSGSAGLCFEFSPEAGDQVSFLKSRSWLSWPTPFPFSIMGAPMTSWRRHSYNRLLWKKLSGAQLEFVWRDEQGFYRGSGWADGNLEIAPLVKISHAS